LILPIQPHLYLLSLSWPFLFLVYLPCWKYEGRLMCLPLLDCTNWFHLGRNRYCN
jgi:hypothetical protein